MSAWECLVGVMGLYLCGVGTDGVNVVVPVCALTVCYLQKPIASVCSQSYERIGYDNAIVSQSLRGRNKPG